MPTHFVDDTIVTGLDQPNAMAFLPDGRLLFTELNSGKIRMVVNGHIAAVDPLVVVDSLTTGAERGLQGIAVDPRWPAYPYVYVGYTHVGSRAVLVRYTAMGDIANPSGESLFLSSKLTLIHDLPDVNEQHNGLGLRFGNDGMLLLTTGDDGFQCAAQTPGSLLGKLFRLDVTRIPAGGGGPVPRALLIPLSGNPFVGPDSNACLVLAQGLRNPWRFHVDAMTGSVLLADVGEGQYEELDEIVAGGNYGWPFREGPATFTPNGCTEPPGSVFDEPIFSIGHQGFFAILTAGVYRPVFAGTANWPSIYQGSLFYGDYFYSQLRRLVRNGSSWITPAPVPGQPNGLDWALGIQFLTDVAVGVKDGSLWWLKAANDAGATNTGMVRRIRYTSTLGVPEPMRHALRASPNPFRERLDLEWAVAEAEPAMLEIFDMAGRRLRRAPVGAAQVGHYAWDGRDDRGTRVGAGVYLVRVGVGPYTETVRVVRVR
ncbi:MAG TPA: PQQ-dependent sugar dehydrogenase [Candidatus Eisenbacteria bacterium]|nr:PQQ-dependent sugar dehydrogenase [Candidatus Eisenbacteria bacterium]